MESAHQWSTTDYLLASVVDALSVANWQRGGNPNAPRPVPLPRPTDTPDPRVTRLTADEIAARLVAMNTRGR